MRKFRYLYGPVPSRRLGRSLGIDIVPHKICSYDCLYCQIGKTTDKTLKRKEYAPVKEILDEVKRFLKDGASSVDHLSLSGSGEPTLHSHIRSIIEGIKSITSIPVAVITNGSMLCEEEVRQDLLRADIILPSLDAVSRDIFLKINRPRPGFDIEKVIEGMVEFRKIFKGEIWLEILFCRGINDGKEELLKLKRTVELIRPDRIHLNTVVRPPSEKGAIPVSPEEMERIKEFFGEKASIISEFNRHPLPESGKDIREEILNVLKRRPLSLSDLSRGMGISKKKLDRYIEPLIADGKIKTRSFGDSTYYEIAKE